MPGLYQLLEFICVGGLWYVNPGTCSPIRWTICTRPWLLSAVCAAVCPAKINAADWGADVMNCIPMIPVQDTPFEHLGEPTDAEMVRIRALASGHLPQMYHGRRCRADAVGLLFSSGKDFSFTAFWL